MRSRRLLAAGTLALGASLGFAYPSFAHSAIVGTVPTDGATITTKFDFLISVETNEDLLNIGNTAEGFAIVVSDANGLYYGDGCVTVDGMTATTNAPITAEGDYTVAYRIVSADGHPVEGSFHFHFTGDDAATPAPAYAEAPTCGVAQDPVNDDSQGSGDGPSDEPTLIATPMPINAPTTQAGPDMTPWIGLATIPLIVGALWVLIRSLGKRDSEDHLN